MWQIEEGGFLIGCQGRFREKMTFEQRLRRGEGISQVNSEERTLHAMGRAADDMALRW